VVREILATDSGSIPSAIRFSEKYWVCKGIHYYLEEKIAAPVQKAENTVVEGSITPAT
jgi:hypothetical protein